jgi:hypothetical protein
MRTALNLRKARALSLYGEPARRDADAAALPDAAAVAVKP